jgi:hypothetical protein
MYKGKYIQTITERDVRVPDVWLMRLMGKVLPLDIGKQVWNQDGVLYVENDEQRDKRLAVGAPDRARYMSVLKEIHELHKAYCEKGEILLAELERAKEGR